MNWKKIICDIQDAGFSQVEIAAHVGKSQAWVSAILNDRVKDVRYQDGAALLVMLSLRPERKAA